MDNIYQYLLVLTLFDWATVSNISQVTVIIVAINKTQKTLMQLIISILGSPAQQHNTCFCIVPLKFSARLIVGRVALSLLTQVCIKKRLTKQPCNDVITQITSRDYSIGEMTAHIHMQHEECTHVWNSYNQNLDPIRVYFLHTPPNTTTNHHSLCLSLSVHNTQLI